MQESIELTEEQQSGTTPPAEATAEAPAPEETDTTVEAVDDPAETIVEPEAPAAEMVAAEAAAMQTEEAPEASESEAPAVPLISTNSVTSVPGCEYSISLMPSVTSVGQLAIMPQVLTSSNVPLAVSQVH